ncbi:hypothetical protein HEK616_34670 [Streptomyces nigrescens]|uniref:Uncharacterized protein n=1 Tax=Streptomyces nigrescens TaxID=1920 RepID=A0ABM7ZUC2_STRNI|nr:hypothetical protein HEK616_34670 [Streptomyces nigrescens]
MMTGVGRVTSAPDFPSVGQSNLAPLSLGMSAHKAVRDCPGQVHDVSGLISGLVPRSGLGLATAVGLDGPVATAVPG